VDIPKGRLQKVLEDPFPHFEAEKNKFPKLKKQN
jgi:hypothetical protein